MVKFIMPKPYKVTEVRGAIVDGMRDTMEVVKVDLMLTYMMWDNPPEWLEVGPRKSGFDMKHTYSTTDTPYVWVDMGTGGFVPGGAPYSITAKFAPMLRYQATYIPRSKPGQLTSGFAAKYGPWISKFTVMHPGIEPREFSKQVAERADEFLAKRINARLGML